MFPKFPGISRDEESPGGKALLIFPDRRLTDDEMRALHDHLNDYFTYAMDVVNEQAEDGMLWFRALTPGEEILQIALRRLHAAIEGKLPEQCAREALNKIHN